MDPSAIAEAMAFGLNEVETSAIEALLHASGLAHSFPQIEKLRSPYFTAAFNLDGGNLRTVQHEDPLHADSLEDPAHSDGLIEAAVALGNHDTFVGLNTLFIPFTDPNANPNGVTDVDIWQIGFQLIRFELSNEIGGVQSNLVGG